MKASHQKLLVLLAVFVAATALAQTGRTNAGPRLYRDQVTPRWFAENTKFWYRVTDRERGPEFVLVKATNGTRGTAFDHERVAQALAKLTGEEISAARLPFARIRFADDGKSVRLIGDEKAWQCDLESYEISEAKLEDSDRERASDESAPQRRRGGGNRSRTPPSTKSPDAKWEAFVRDHNLFLRNLDTKEETKLTTDGSATNSYARDGERNRSVEMEYETRDPETETPEVFWAPDSKRFVAMRNKPGTKRSVYLIESSPKEQVQPKLQSYPYLKPGDDVPVRKPRLFEVEAKKEIPVSDALFENPWSIGELRWSRDSSRCTFLFNQRGHQVLRVIAIDAKSGEVKPLIDERSETFVNYSGAYFCEYLDDAGEIVWMSERDGWNHLYLYDAKTGEVKNQITKGEWVVRGVERVDREKRQIWFRASGIRPGQDPYFIHYCRVNFDGTGLTLLTEGDGTHSVQFSPDRRFLIDTWSRVDLPPVNELRRSEDGKLVCKLEEADASDAFKGGWQAPQQFVAKGRDGVTDIYGVIHRPKNFDAKKKYPIIEQIYAGPQDSFVPKSWRSSYRWERLAERGFIIVQIDGMGTANRSKKFHDVCWKNLGDAGFPDRVAWIKAAAAKYLYMDATRVGLYGGSAGGQSALGGLLLHGDFYKAAAADCGCHDNRMDKIWWNEQWMGWPVGPHYEEASNVTHAHKLKGKLLLTVGELDRNVDPASTMQVVNALIKANKDFELIVFPGAGHGAGGGAYGERRRNDFFVRSLLEPKQSSAAETVSDTVSGERSRSSTTQ